MKKLFVAGILFASLTHADIQNPTPAPQETLAQKVERFKKENPHTYHILRTFLKNCGKYSNTVFPVM